MGGTDDREAPDDKDMAFHPNFLNRRVVPREEETGPFPVGPDGDTFEAVDNFDQTPVKISSIEGGRTTLLRKARLNIINLSCVVTKGIVCDRCHRTVTRSDFAVWRCKTRSCRFYVQKSSNIEKLFAIIDSRDHAVVHEVDDLHRDIIRLEVVSDLPRHTIRIFHLPQSCSIICADPAGEVSQALGGPDDYWRSAIAEAVGGGRSLKRGINLSKAKLGGMESNHYYTAHGK